MKVTLLDSYIRTPLHHVQGCKKDGNNITHVYTWFLGCLSLLCDNKMVRD